VSTSMTQSEREEFLAAVRVGVLAVSTADGGAPLTTPVWYRYEPGGAVRLATGRGTGKAQAIGAAGQFSLCAQDEQPPYKYVTVAGPAVIEAATDDDWRILAHRYLGVEGGDEWLAAAGAETGDSVVITMTPEHWRTNDFSKPGG
jgi:nitroimidazol reductase NimA-like FMN-containing flavoprotein (pyridoxamine 5'-phosphate oxidase superfamily)